MISSYIAVGLFIIYFLYKSVWMIKSFTMDKTESEKSASIDKAYGKETFMLLGLCVLVLLLGMVLDF
ncbi:MAG: hypothetical protein N0C84_09850 [Candidatus Thiodiazotropha taylori]|uniref:Uncharacterized protein n=1 Tax=Candidatus Thiodiazotropha taylori TaxID=2792791 RepID=A0A9E4N4Z3_9GAMM|nr:hypothetical protein [Candidatus Thiodiazotropha taylori]MCW4256750.1 hypothetical protein [Candidatus Thiodiazotropha taylori]